MGGESESNKSSTTNQVDRRIANQGGAVATEGGKVEINDLSTEALKSVVDLGDTALEQTFDSFEKSLKLVDNTAQRNSELASEVQKESQETAKELTSQNRQFLGEVLQSESENDGERFARLGTVAIIGGAVVLGIAFNQ